ncbi:hypothetical protein UlMin_024774 [Ulmus minor]
MYYHKQDQFGRLLPTFIQVIDLMDQEESEYWDDVSAVFDGRQLDDFTSNPSFNSVTLSSMETSINNKSNYTHASIHQEKQADKSYSLVVLGEVVIVCWPLGEIIRLRTGSTAADVARRVGLEGKLMAN